MSRRGFTLLEVILVMALIGVMMALVLPSLDTAFGRFSIERAGEDLQIRLAELRHTAMERGVPYAFAFRPDTDESMTWAIEPISANPNELLQRRTSVVSSGASAERTGDAYDRRQFVLNSDPDRKVYRFLASDPTEALESMGLDVQMRQSLGMSSNSAAGEDIMAQHKLINAYGSARSQAALQIPGLQTGTASEPIVFEPDGTVDRDVIIRLVDDQNNYVELMVQSLTGSITVSRVRHVSELQGQFSVIQQSTGRSFAPSQSREVTPLSGGGNP